MNYYKLTDEDRKRFDKLSLEDSFVLSSTDAVKFMLHAIEVYTEQLVNCEMDAENFAPIMDDLAHMIHGIQVEPAEFMKIEESPMSASNMAYVPMVERGE